MPNRKEEKPVEFTVTDRRLFTSDGQLRSGVEMEPPKAGPPPPTKPASEPPRGQARPETPRPEPPREPPGPVKLEHLIMSLATTAMLQMGLAARPGEPPPPPDFAAAQETIDLLELLHEKTKGNLTQEEEEVLAGSLYELRLAFVELTRRAGRSR